VREKKNAYKFIVGILEGRTAIGRAGRGWEGNIKKDPKEYDWTA
jgi:hypothetical protein